MLDGSGHIWIFSNAHGKGRPSYIHRSKKPLSIDEFELIRTTNFSYGQPWWLPGKGFLFLHTIYEEGGRSLFSMTSPQGREWSEPRLMARIAMGHYQVSARQGGRVGAMFNYHPAPVGLNARTNLYYMETADQGRTWRTAGGAPVENPLKAAANPALVHDYQSEKLLVYIKDLNFDAQHRPVLLYMTSRGYASGPANDPRTWRTARWTGAAWDIRPFTTSDHNYDFGSLYIEPGGVWRVIAPTEPGPQPYTTGGEMVMWTSGDRGRTWKKVRQLTRQSPYNHTYARRPIEAHPDFYALWADGNTKEPSESHLYFCNRAGDVSRLPAVMNGEFERPSKEKE
jgi:hypothetical protein